MLILWLVVQSPLKEDSPMIMISVMFLSQPKVVHEEFDSIRMPLFF